jgi:hypothetical protein
MNAVAIGRRSKPNTVVNGTGVVNAQCYNDIMLYRQRIIVLTVAVAVGWIRTNGCMENATVERDIMLYRQRTIL